MISYWWTEEEVTSSLRVSRHEFLISTGHHLPGLLFLLLLLFFFVIMLWKCLPWLCILRHHFYCHGKVPPQTMFDIQTRPYLRCSDKRRFAQHKVRCVRPVSHARTVQFWCQYMPLEIELPEMKDIWLRVFTVLVWCPNHHFCPYTKGQRTKICSANNRPERLESVLWMSQV